MAVDLNQLVVFVVHPWPALADLERDTRAHHAQVVDHMSNRDPPALDLEHIAALINDDFAHTLPTSHLQSRPHSSPVQTPAKPRDPRGRAAPTSSPSSGFAQ